MTNTTLPQTKLVTPMFIAERGATEVASSTRIPEAPAATFSKREKGSSAAGRKGLVIAGVVLFGAFGATACSKGEKHSSADANASAAVNTKTAAADTKPKCKSGMVSIPAGTFTMGDADNTSKDGQVTVAAFCMDTTEVTTSAYATCVKSSKCTAAETGTFCNADATGHGNHPINCVDWPQATAYCAAQGQRLPTEEEWEYAARGTDGRLYPWGNAEPGGQLCWGGEGDSLGKGKRQSTCAVASIPAGNSPFGLADMSGNVEEWTSSPYSATDADRVHRGGGYEITYLSFVRSAFRISVKPSFQFGTLGFRCAGSLSP